MKQLYKQRARLHLEKMMKYMKYIFNDHLMIVLFFLLGGLALSYSSLLKTLTAPLWWVPVLFIIVVFLGLLQGKLPTLLKEADAVFLLPKETELKSYLTQAKYRGIWLPIVLEGAIIGIMMPLLVLNGNATFKTYLLFVIMAVLLKWADLTYKEIALYRVDKLSVLKYGLYLIELCIIGTVIYVSPILAIGLSVACAIVMELLWQRVQEAAIFSWQVAIQKEEARMTVLYRFINLFTDVPEVKTVVHRRRYFDSLLSHITHQQKNTYLYLYMRHLLRSNDYIGLIIRLVVIGSIILFFNDVFYMNVILAVLMLYLILFQLVPLYRVFDVVVPTQLYPVSLEDKQNALRKILMYVALCSSVVMSVCSLHTLSFLQSFIIFILLCLEGWLFNRLLLKRQLKHYED